ncbi:MAG: PDZ domain-containing protein [Actinobacteria bacterium]|nr:MAG: PDZ domain-containing protein [Actinomycetota bacterium]
MHLPRTTVIAALAAAVAIGAGGGVAAYSAFNSSTKTVVRQVTVDNSTPASATSSLSVNEIYRRAYKGVVELTVTSNQGATPFGGSNTQRAQGSGFVYDTQGDIVTNEHVVDGATSVSVQFWNGATYKATVVGTDASTDLAVVHVNAPSSLLVPLGLGNSDNVAVGDGAVAIGSPFGLEETVTSGIVSALHRQIEAPNNFTIANAIQTDAAINHGNSGGPLLDMQGKVIGVNAQIQSDSGGNEGVGFAIPSNTVKSVVTQLVGSGKVEHAFLGVSAVTIPASVAGDLNLAAGAEVATIRTGTPAAKAGFRAATGARTVNGQDYPTGGDVITAVDGKKIATVNALIAAVNAHKPGDTASITYVRGGKSHTIRVKLANRPA